MAIKVITETPNIPRFTYPANTNTSYTAGSLLYRDTTNGYLSEATASVGITTNLEGIGVRTFTSAASSAQIDAIPLYGRRVIVLVDCTNSTAANQLCKAQPMTDARTVANTSSHTATTLAVFIPIATVGAASAKQLLGYFVCQGQVAA